MLCNGAILKWATSYIVSFVHAPNARAKIPFCPFMIRVPAVTVGEMYRVHNIYSYPSGNVLKELVEGAGATIDCAAFSLGDPTLSARELWGAEYQESSACLVPPEQRPQVKRFASRERCPVDFVGVVADDNQVIAQLK